MFLSLSTVQNTKNLKPFWLFVLLHMLTLALVPCPYFGMSRGVCVFLLRTCAWRPGHWAPSP